MIDKLNEDKARLDQIDIMGVLQQIVVNNYHQLSSCKKLAEKVIKIAKARMAQFSGFSHRIFIRFIITQPKTNPTDYYETLLNWTKQTQSEF